MSHEATLVKRCRSTCHGCPIRRGQSYASDEPASVEVFALILISPSTTPWFVLGHEGLENAAPLLRQQHLALPNSASPRPHWAPYRAPSGPYKSGVTFAGCRKSTAFGQPAGWHVRRPRKYARLRQCLPLWLSCWLSRPRNLAGMDGNRTHPGRLSSAPQTVLKTAGLASAAVRRRPLEFGRRGSESMTVLVRPQSAVVSAVSLAVVGASETAADPASSTAVAGRIDDYNRERPHQALKYRTPSEVRREALESTQSTA